MPFQVSMSAAHCYILLAENYVYPRGELLELNYESRTYRSHKHNLWFASSGQEISCASHEVAALTNMECHLLTAIEIPADRYAVYSTPGKMAWGLKLGLGDTVQARIHPSRGTAVTPGCIEVYSTAVIRWCGTIGGIEKYLFGIEITEKRYFGRGNNDGKHGKQYFTCAQNNGLFLSLAELQMPSSLNATSASSSNSQELATQLERQLRETLRLQNEVKVNETRISSLQGEMREKAKLQGEMEASLQGGLRETARLQGEVSEKEATIARLQGEMREKASLQGEMEASLQTEIREKARLQGEMREKEATITRQQEEVREKEATIARQQEEVREKETVIARLQEENEAVQVELRQVREETEQYQQQWRDQQVQHQQLTTRINTAIAHLRGEAAPPQQALQLWELPREEVHISQTILGTGGWGYVARGTFQGQPVAVKCLHRGILSPQNEERVRREISIMAQVRHPNLLLLIGAVLTVEGAGPLIVSELLERSLRSAYESESLEERSKLPVLRDVASALTYLHSHRTPIIHRDVSSANVLLESVNVANESLWKAKLSDFGSANLSHLATTPAEGAAVYAAPEVSTEDRSRQTPKIDVYSFGVLACEVCLCRFPPERREFPSMLREVQGAAPNMFPLARDCTSHAHHSRPAMRDILRRLDELAGTQPTE